MKNPIGNIVLVVLAMGFGSGIWLQASANQQLREEQSRLLMQAAELARLHTLHTQNAVTTASPSDLEKLQSEIDEANQLRGQIEKFKDAQIRLIAQNTPSIVQKKSESVWRNVGQATPADTLHSVMWAAINGEVETLIPMLTFDAESRAVSEALRASLPEATRAQYPTVEKLIATMIAGRMATDFVKADMVEQIPENADAISAKVQLQRSGNAAKSREVGFRFQRSGSEWQLLVPKSVIDDYWQSLKRR